MASKDTERAAVSAGAASEIYSRDLVAREWFLNHYFPDDPLTLSKRVTALKFQDQVAESIRANMAAGANLRSLADELSDYTTVEDVNKTIREIERMARRVIAGDTEEYAEFQKLVRSARDDALAMIESNQPSKLGKAYARVSDAAESLNEAALDRAIENALEKKALSNAFRIATTEISKAVNVGEFTRASDDEDCLAMELVLSPAGNNCDDCVDLAETDNGAGPGIWPMDQVPATPIHPRCRCRLLPVYKLPEDTDPDFGVDSEDYDGPYMEKLPE